VTLGEGIGLRLRPVKQRSGILRKWACAAAALAGLTGASGIILAATAAHGVPDPRLQTAANFMLLHAAATLAVCGLSFAAPQRGVWFLGAAGLFLCGSLLFGGDLAARALAGTTLLILGWVFVALAALVVLPQTADGKPDQKIDE